MPSNQTTNYQLSQWAKSDQVKMEDFNADNAKIDGALASHAAALAGKGNCTIWTTTYTGTGTYGQDKPNSLTFPKLPLFALIIDHEGDMMPLVPGRGLTVFHSPGDGGRSVVSWSGTTATWYASMYPSQYVQMNASGCKYLAIAFYLADQA